MEAVEDAIDLEHYVTNEIIRIHRIAEKTCKDIHVNFNFKSPCFYSVLINSIFSKNLAYEFS